MLGITYVRRHNSREGSIRNQGKGCYNLSSYCIHVCYDMNRYSPVHWKHARGCKEVHPCCIPLCCGTCVYTCSSSSNFAFLLSHTQLSMRNVTLTFGSESVLTFENLSNPFYLEVVIGKLSKLPSSQRLRS